MHMALERLGRYEIIEELGHGAMGVVYKARDPLIDRPVAIKTVSLELSPEESEAFVHRFYSEAKAAGRLNHSNIVTIHDVGDSNGVAYIAMEFLQGRSLREILDSGVVLPPEKIADIIAQVADGLAFAHENGIVHRDIKPANIMVLDSGRVKIMDFGIAHLPAGSRTWAGTLLGSPKYMAPERIAGKKVDGRADIFSLGAVLYEMLTGCPPFVGDDLEALVDQVINKTPAPPRSRNKTIPIAFNYIVATSMAKRPDDRYPNAWAMASAVRNFRDPRPPAFVPDGPPPLAHSPAAGVAASQKDDLAEGPAAVRIAFGQRRKLVVFGGTAALIFILASAVLLSQRASNTPPPVTREGDDAAPAKKLADASLGTPEIGDEEGEPAERAAPAAAASSSQPPAHVTSRPTHVAPPMARLGLAVTPWGEIYVDGKRKGVTPPLTEIRIAPGKHTIEIRNTTFPSYAQSIDLAANGSLKIRHKFQ
jgi:predicted Ser/Thr protein kinase